MNSNWTFKTIAIKGKDYVTINERVKCFRNCPEFDGWAIKTEILHFDADSVMIKASVIDKDGKVLATGHAQEERNSTMINKTSYVENCVPLSTQILTKSGWKYFYQLKENEEVLSLNTETKKIEYCKVLGINIYKDKPILNLKTSRFNATCTPQHKWIAKKQNKDIEKVATQDLTNSWQIIQAVRQNVIPSDKGRKLGWLMCDCEINYTNGLPSTAYINQSKHIEEITSLFGEGRKTKKYNENWLDNYEWVISAEEVRRILGEFDIVDYKDLSRAILNADIEDVAGCFEAVMLADGSSRGFSSTYYELVEAVQLMCVRLGIATTFITSTMKEKSTKPLYTIGIKKTQGAYFSEMEIKNLPPQDVWCPTTENGNWFMRQGTFVTLTSNCETSAVGRALGLLGIGIENSIATYDEVKRAISTQEEMEKESKKVDSQVLKYIKEATDVEELTLIWNTHKELQSKDEFKNAIIIRRNELK